ncbi:hypothetical protein ACVI1T_004952 [Rhizobium redzepovicii]
MVTMVGNEGNIEKLDLLYLNHEAIAAYFPASAASTTKLSGGKWGNHSEPCMLAFARSCLGPACRPEEHRDRAVRPLRRQIREPR